MPERRGDFELRRPPPELDPLIEWFGELSDRLVLLEEYAPGELEFGVDRLSEALRIHLCDPPAVPTPDRATGHRSDDRLNLLRTEHARFRISLEQLAWFLAIVVAENHGGHRQALGQYGRVLVEALRRHREDERRIEAASARVRATSAIRLAEKP